MNPLIKKELEHVNIAILPSYNDNSSHIIIQKGIRNLSEMDVEEGKYYQIKVKDYIIHPYEGFNLHSQWNNNIIPKDDTMNIHVLQTMGKMIKVNGIGIHTNTPWIGWLPKSSFQIISLI